MNRNGWKQVFVIKTYQNFGMVAIHATLVPWPRFAAAEQSEEAAVGEAEEAVAEDAAAEEAAVEDAAAEDEEEPEADYEEDEERPVRAEPAAGGKAAPAAL